MSQHKRAWLRLFLGCLAAYGTALVARHALVPDVVPLAFGVDAVLLLRAIELGAVLGAILLGLAAFGSILYPRRPHVHTTVQGHGRGRF